MSTSRITVIMFTVALCTGVAAWLGLASDEREADANPGAREFGPPRSETNHEAERAVTAPTESRPRRERARVDSRPSRVPETDADVDSPVTRLQGDAADAASVDAGTTHPRTRFDAWVGGKPPLLQCSPATVVGIPVRDDADLAGVTLRVVPIDSQGADGVPVESRFVHAPGRVFALVATGDRGDAERVRVELMHRSQVLDSVELPVSTDASGEPPFRYRVTELLSLGGSEVRVSLLRGTSSFATREAWFVDAEERVRGVASLLEAQLDQMQLPEGRTRAARERIWNEVTRLLSALRPKGLSSASLEDADASKKSDAKSE